jgi:hypothetical protein
MRDNSSVKEQEKTAPIHGHKAKGAAARQRTNLS